MAATRSPRHGVAPTALLSTGADDGVAHPQAETKLLTPVRDAQWR